MKQKKIRREKKNYFNFRSGSSLKRASSCLQAFDRFQHDTIGSAKDFLRIFSDSGLKESFNQYRNQTLPQANKVLSAFVDQKLNHFNIFHRVGFTANEDRLSDAVVALLNSNECHGLGTLPLKFLLEGIRDRAPTKVEAILPFVGVPAHIKVREREGKAIPDIQIISNNFIIFIENKIQGGREISHPRAFQTDRYWKELKRKGERLGIPEERLLPMFLNPEWKGAKNGNFVSLSVDEIVSALSKAVDASPACPCKDSIKSFLDFYSYSNTKRREI